MHATIEPRVFAREVGAVAQATSPGLPDCALWKDAAALTVHTPDTIETRRDGMAAPLTPAPTLFVRNYLPPPTDEIAADPMRWGVEFEGVAAPVRLTLRELLAFGSVTEVCVLQCAGNGRTFFSHDPEGTPWTVGAAGNVAWSGVPLRPILEALGGPVAARFLTATGAEPVPHGAGPEGRMERSVPIAAVENAMLAFAMNGEALSVAHGGPLRLVIPGYYGVNNIKYVRRIALTANESDCDVQRTGYRLRPLGEPASG